MRNLMNQWTCLKAIVFSLSVLLAAEACRANEADAGDAAEPPGFDRYSTQGGPDTFTPTRQFLIAHFEQLQKAKPKRRKLNLYPLGQLGVIVVRVQGLEGLVVSGVLEPPAWGDTRTFDSPPKGLQFLDRIISINGTELGDSNDHTAGQCAIQILGKELNKAEGSDSPLRLKVAREATRAGEEGKIVELAIPIEKRGAFDPQTPHLGKKADRYREIAFKRLLALEDAPGARDSVYGPEPSLREFGTYMAGVALLSAGDEEALKVCGRIAEKIRERFTEGAMEAWGLNQWTWYTGMATVFLAEYYWATGDPEVFEQLEKMADYLATYVNPDGGVGHKKLKGTYRQLSFSPAMGLTVLGLTMAEKCGVAIDREALEKVLAYYERNGISKEEPPNAVSYGGTLQRRGLGGYSDGASRTSTYVLTLSMLDLHPEAREAMLDWLASIPSFLTSTHSSPTLGEFFAALALARERPDDYAALLRERIYSLTVSLDHNEIFEYMPPADMYKSKGADSNLGFAQMANARPLILLTGYRRNILLTGTEKPLGWLANTPAPDLTQRHLERIRRVLDRHRQAVDEEEWVEANDWLRFIERRYLHPSQKALPEKEAASVGKQVSQLRRELEKSPGWQAASMAIRDRAARKYLTWRLMIRPNCAGILQEFQEKYGETRFAGQVAELEAKLKKEGNGAEGQSASYMAHFDLLESLTESEPEYFLAKLMYRTVLPTSEQEGQQWRYTTEEPVDWTTTWSWTQPDFDDSAWKTGKGMFGTKGAPGARIETKWDTEYVFLRRSFDLEKIPTQPILRVLNDDVAWVYVNGERATKLRRRNIKYVTVPIDRSMLREGRNVLAVVCQQQGGEGQVVDVGIVEIEKVTDEGSGAD